MKTNRDGRDIKRVLEWLLRRRVVDAEIAKALGPMATATYSRRKEHDDFPTFEELEQIGDSFGLSAKVLQISFGYRGEDELILLNDEELALLPRPGGRHFPGHGVRNNLEARRGDGLMGTIAPRPEVTL